MGRRKKNAPVQPQGQLARDESSQLNGPDEQPQAPQEVVKLRRCRKCGGRRFVLDFSRGKLRYTILARCVRCGTRRVISLDVAHAAKTRRNGPPHRGRRRG
jgi:hypothetical protein